MTRLALLLSIALPSLCSAQLVASREDDGTLVYEMIVTPSKEPTPRLRYRLVTPDQQLVPGNAATFWYRAMLDLDRDIDRATNALGEKLVPEAAEAGQDLTSEQRSAARAAWRRWTASFAAPLSEIPIDSARVAANEVLDGRRRSLVAASRRVNCDWGLGARQLRGPDALDFLLPEFQGMRDLSRALCLEARVAIADGRLDQALETLRLNNEMALDAATPPYLVCRLIGSEISRLSCGALRDLQCHPDAPSLYWALADLPRPFIKGREAIRFEAGIAFRLYELLADPEMAERTDAAWDRLLAECLDSLAELAADQVQHNPAPHDGEEAKALVEWIDTLRNAGLDHWAVQFARERLIEQGFDTAKLDAMPLSRLLAIDAARVCRRLNDPIETAVQLPWPEGRSARDVALAALEAADPLGEAPTREVLPIAKLTAANTRAAMAGLVMRDRALALIRLVEALRLHAGIAGGLPRTLDEIECVPVPRNPASGEAFGYRLADGVATITAPASDGPAWAERYEVRLAH